MRQDRKPRPSICGSKHKIDLKPLRRRIETAWRRSEALAAEGRIAEARTLLERAHRRSGSDQNLALALALLRLRDGDAEGAATLFAGVASRHDVREAWTGLATASLLTGDAAAAAHACARALRTHVPDAGLIAAASAAVRAGAAPGWCGLTEAGEVLASPEAGPLTLTLDGKALKAGTTTLPRGWESAESLRVQAGGADLLGSPIDARAILRVEGFVERTPAGIHGWAWHPAAPDTDPPLRVLDAAGHERLRLVATDLTAETDGDTPSARPRAFALTIGWPGPVRILGRDGADLAGSPVAECPTAHPPVRPTPKAPAAQGPADVVIPVFRGLAQTVACVHSVLETVPRHTRVWVVDDGSPERDLVAALQAMAASGRIHLIPSGPVKSGRRNLGFPAAANTGLRAASGRDVVLLNADTLVAPGWLARLQRAAHSAADIGTATPLSNEASIFSVPDPAGSQAPDLAGTRRLAALAARANAGVLVDVPTAHGFCMFIRADCLAETGLFRDDLFAQGYGEENDFCVRAQALGWRHVAVPSVYVAHEGGVSFGASRRHLLRRNLDLLGRLHPGYHQEVAAWAEADPLSGARRRLDAAIWRDRAASAPAHRGAVLLVSHDRGGGTARVVASRVAALQAEGFRPLMLTGSDGACTLSEPGGDPTPNLRFPLPTDMPRFVRLLAPWRPVAMEIHHVLGHDPSVRRLARRFDIPIDEWVHDYAFLCPRITLTDGEGRYCGEPPPAECERCVSQWGREDEQAITPATLRARSAAHLADARSVVVPSADVASRVRRHAQGAAPAIRPWAEETATPPPAARHGGGLRVAVVGAIGTAKGFSVILACAKDAAARALNLSFAIVGYTVDDDALEATGHVTITGPFEAGEAAGLIRAQGAGLAFIPSTWPETWCFALTDAWEAGLRACVFDIGTQAQRVRASGFGWVLPLGLPPERVNDHLLALGDTAAQPLPPLVSRGTIR